MCPTLRIKPRGRLVEEQHLRLVRQADANIKPPSLPAGVGAGSPISTALELETPDELRGPRSGRCAAHSEQPALEDEFGATSDLGVAAAALTDVTNSFSHLGRLAGQVGSGHPRLTAAWRKECREHSKRGGLAGSVRTEKAVYLAGRDVQVDAGNGLNGTAAAFEDASKFARLDCQCCFHTLSMASLPCAASTRRRGTL